MQRGVADGSSHIGADVCVVGAGPAGLAVAAELSRVGVDVVVLEAGGAAYDRHRRSNAPQIVRDHLLGAQALARGRNRGVPYYPLRLSRARGLGGSTNALLSHGLRARPLDSIDFEPRSGAGGHTAGWPIAYEEFAQFIDAAARFVGFESADARPLDWAPHHPVLGAQRWTHLSAAPVRHARRRAIPERATAMAAGSQPRIITSTVVTGFRAVASNRVGAVEAQQLGGGSLRVEADVFVIAAGGIDNARLLLAARPVLYAMGEAADQVGRFFMEHPHYVAGYLVPSSDAALSELLELAGDFAGDSHWLTIGDDLVRSEGLLRVAVTGSPVAPASLHPAVPAAGELARLFPFGPYGLRQRAGQAAKVLRGGRQVAGAIAGRIRQEARTVLALPVMGEQSPDPDSRVVLGNRLDRTGLPLPELHWRLDHREFAAVKRTIDVLAEETERSGLGSVRSLWDEGRSGPDVVTGGWHHMGTTRMSVDPADGVVDLDCRVHGIDNLFVAGSSVFATSGYANPTLTLVALAVRLGRHLAAGGI